MADPMQWLLFAREGTGTRWGWGIDSRRNVPWGSFSNDFPTFFPGCDHKIVGSVF